jgi:hypothetical protein
LDGDTDERDACFDETNRLYEQEFGENCLSMTYFSSGLNAESCKKGCGAGCRQKCKSVTK